MIKAKNGKHVEARILLTSKVIETAWRSILEQTIPPETHPDLVKTFKRFFYAGAKTLLENLLYTNTLDDGEEPTPKDIQRLDGIFHELNQFFGEVAAGRQ